MPYEIIKLPNRKFSVINKISRHNFSPKGITKAMATKQMKLLYMKAREMEGAGAASLEGGSDGGVYDAMSDTDLHKYFPHARIVKYSELPQGVPAEDFLKKTGDIVYILYESTLNSGHWVALARGEKAFYYFDSYGNKPGVPLSWNSPETNKELGQDQPTLVKMFSITKLPVYFNDYPYQSKKDTDIATCGRWATAFLVHFKKYKGDLKSFKTETLKRAGKRDLDEFITKIVDE
jgi:hypothetical protein